MPDVSRTVIKKKEVRSLIHQDGSLRKLVVIGVDGADWKLIDPWLRERHLRHLNEIINEGMRGTLMSTIPPFTLPSWTSIFTGVNPGKHGITDNLIRIADRITPALSVYRKVPLIWRLLSYSGLKSIIVNDPVTYPPEPINGIMVTGFLTPPDSGCYTYPPEIKDEIDKASGGYMPELPLDYDKMIAHNKKEAHDYVQRFAQKTADLALHLMMNHEWDMFNVTFTSTDRLQHFYWQDEHLLKKHYVWLDSVIGNLLNLASSEDANLLVVSDHGFAPVYKSVYVNTVLTQEGLIEIKKSKIEQALLRMGLNTEGLTNLLTRTRLHTVMSILAPEKLKRILPSKYSKSTTRRPIAKLTSASGIFIERDLCDDYEAVRSRIIDMVLSIRDGGSNVMAGAYRREEVLWGPYISRAPDIIVMPNEGYYLSTAIRDDVLGEPLQHGSDIRRTGDHSMIGIFIAYGPNIKKRCKLNFDVQTWDIAPTLLHILGLHIPDYMDGRVLKEIFKEGARPGLRPVKLRKHRKPIPRQVAEEVHALKEEEIKKRLRSLGYL